MGFHKDLISVLAAINTSIAAAIAALKALGLPEKKAIEHHKLSKMAESIRYTTRKLKAGLSVDAVAEADAMQKGQDDVEDEAQIVIAAGTFANGLPPKGESKQQDPPKEIQER